MTQGTYTVHLPFIQHGVAQSWEFVGALRQVPGDTFDVSTWWDGEGQTVDLRMLNSATVRLNDGLSLMVAIVEDV